MHSPSDDPAVPPRLARWFEDAERIDVAPTGVHHPGDVVAGSLMGTALAQLTTHALERHATRRR